VTPKIDSTPGQRIQLDEVEVYTVKDGKIVKEEYFYSL